MQNLINQTIANQQITDIEFRLISYLNYKILWENKHMLLTDLLSIYQTKQIKTVLNKLIKKKLITKLTINNKEYLGFINNQNQIIW